MTNSNPARIVPPIGNPGPQEASIMSEANKSDHGYEEIRAWLLRELSDRLRLPAHDIDASRDVAEYGLDSLQAVRLSGDLETWLGRRLPATLLWEFPSMDSLARHLASRSVPQTCAR
jgi:acyl carrier protein